jgi:hypothetical protein
VKREDDLKKLGRNRQFRNMMNCEMQLAGGPTVLPDGQKHKGTMCGFRSFRPGTKLRPTHKRMCRCMYMISRRLSPYFMFFHAFFTPFLSHKGLISRRLQRKHGLIEFAEGIAELELTQRRRDAETQRPIKKAKSKMKNEGRFRDSSPRLLPFQRVAGGGKGGANGETPHDKTQ